MDIAKEIQKATVTRKGDDWGDPPLWTIAPAAPADAGEEWQPAWLIEIHATDAKAARAAALENAAAMPVFADGA